MQSNDSNNLRLDAAVSFVNKLGTNDRAAVVDFSGSATLRQGFTNNHSSLNSAIQQIGNNGSSTNLSAGINMAISQFTGSSYTRTDAYKYIIFLTDGIGDYNSNYTVQASENNITIYSIGLGSGVNSSLLSSIATGTGGRYYFASTATTLPEIYDDIAVDTIDYTKDSNGDGISDYYTKLISEGRCISGTGINFFNGISYSDLQANDDYDGDGIKNGDEAIVSLRSDGLVYIYFNTDPCKEDTDDDGLLDMDDSYPLIYNTWITYNRESVIDYCNNYAKNPNFEYGFFARGDCANFASQCLHAGGIPMNSSWYFFKSVNIDLQSLNIATDSMTYFYEHYINYYTNSTARYSKQWSVAYDNYIYFSSNQNLSYCDFIEFTSKEEMQTAIENGLYDIQPGDLMYMQWDKGYPHHATVIDGIDHNKNTITFSAHTTARNKDDVIEHFWESYPEGKLYIIRLRDVIITS